MGLVVPRAWAISILVAPRLSAWSACFRLVSMLFSRSSRWWARSSRMRLISMPPNFRAALCSGV